MRDQDTEIDVNLKANESAKDFEPAVGATMPKGLKAYALPPPAIYDIPLLKRYTYAKLKHQVLIINPMSHKIVAVFPED